MNITEKSEIEMVYGDYANVKEDKLIRLAKKGDVDAEEIIIRRYKDVVKSKAGFYYMAGSDRDDIIQEGMIGIFKAIRDFDDTKGASFQTFAEMCITRQIITAIKRATRKKHAPLNTYVSISSGMSGELGTIELENMPSGYDLNPELQYLLKEEIDHISTNVPQIFSKFEWRVWSEYINGKSQHEIAERVGRSLKSVDNAVQRIKKKIEIHLAK